MQWLAFTSSVAVIALPTAADISSFDAIEHAVVEAEDATLAVAVSAVCDDDSVLLQAAHVTSAAAIIMRSECFT
jgi:hypothetical protein